ncbi:MAG: hypothetical protein QXH17_08300 [Candidatus Bathyarchaeia archaeon]
MICEKPPACEDCSRIWVKLRKLRRGDLVECLWLDSCLFRRVRYLTRSVYRTEKKTVGYFHSIKEDEYLILINELTDGETYLEGNSLLIRGIIELTVRVPASKSGYHKTPKKTVKNNQTQTIKIIQTIEKVALPN